MWACQTWDPHGIHLHIRVPNVRGAPSLPPYLFLSPLSLCVLLVLLLSFSLPSSCWLLLKSRGFCYSCSAFSIARVEYFCDIQFDAGNVQDKIHTYYVLLLFYVLADSVYTKLNLRHVSLCLGMLDFTRQYSFYKYGSTITYLSEVQPFKLTKIQLLNLFFM
jgi:hypothetical protein